MNRRSSQEIARIIQDGTAIDQAIAAAHRRILLHHRQLGIPLVIWRDGQVVEVDPDTVELPADAGGAETPGDDH